MKQGSYRAIFCSIFWCTVSVQAVIPYTSQALHRLSKSEQGQIHAKDTAFSRSAMASLYLRNADSLAVSLGCLIMINPVVATIGATVALSIGGMMLYESLKGPFNIFVAPQNIIQGQSVPAEETYQLYEFQRQYYEQRKKQLLKLKQDFIAFKSGLEAIYQLSHYNKMLISYDVISSLNRESTLLAESMSSHDEQHMTQSQREALTNNREAELQRLEAQSIVLQIIIGLHFNELVERLHNGYNWYDNYAPSLNKIVALTKPESVVCQRVAWNNVEIVLRGLHIINKIERRMYELTMAIRYYKTVDDSSIMKRTTNIARVIETFEQQMTEKKLFFQEKKEWFMEHEALYEQYLSATCTHVARLKEQLLAKIRAEGVRYESQEFQHAQIKYRKLLQNY